MFVGNVPWFDGICHHACKNAIALLAVRSSEFPSRYWLENSSERAEPGGESFVENRIGLIEPGVIAMVDQPNKSAQRQPVRRHSVKLPETSARVTLDEIQDVMADTGYSADQRKGWLKEVLTELTKEQSRQPSANKARVIETVKEIADDNQKGTPIAKDVL